MMTWRDWAISGGRSCFRSASGSKDGVGRLWEDRYSSNFAVFADIIDANSAMRVVGILEGLRR